MKQLLTLKYPDLIILVQKSYIFVRQALKTITYGLAGAGTSALRFGTSLPIR